MPAHARQLITLWQVLVNGTAVIVYTSINRIMIIREFKLQVQRILGIKGKLR